MARLADLMIRVREEGLREANREVRELVGNVDRLEREQSNLNRTTRTANAEQNRLNRTNRESARGLNSLGGSYRSVAAGALAAYGAIQLLRGLSGGIRFFRESVDDVTNINNQLKQATANTLELARARRTLEAISLDTRTSFTDNVEGFTRVSIALPDADLATRLTVLENFNKLVAIGGSTAEEASNSLRQLGQSFAGGIVRAEEYNSIVENTPAVVRQIAQSLGIGVGQLRLRVIDGRLTAEDVLGGLSSEETTKYVNQQFTTLAPTIQGAGLTLRGQLRDTLGEFISGTGLGESIANFALDIAGGLNTIGESARENGEAVGEFFGAIRSNLANQSIGQFISGVFGGTAGQLDYSAIDLTGTGTQSIIQQLLDDIEKNTKKSADATDEPPQEELPVNPGFFIGDGSRTTTDPVINNAVTRFLGQVGQGIVEGLTGAFVDGDIDPFGGGARQNAPTLNFSGSTDSFIGFVDAAGVGLDGYTNIQRQATVALQAFRDELFGLPQVFRTQLLDTRRAPPGQELTETFLAELNASNFINFAVERGVRVPQVNFGQDRNPDGSLITPQQQANLIRALAPQLFKAFENAGLIIELPGIDGAPAGGGGGESAAERAKRLFDEGNAAYVQFLDNIDRSNAALADFLAPGEGFDDALDEPNRRAREEELKNLTELNAQIGVIGNSFETLADISDQSAKSVASGLMAIGDIFSQFGLFGQIIGEGLGIVAGIITAIDALVGTTSDTGFRVGAGGNSVDTRRSGLSGFFLGRNGSRDTTFQEDLAIDAALQPNIKLIEEVGDIFNRTFTDVQGHGQTIADAAENFLDQSARQIGGIDALQMSGESLGDTLIRVARSADEANRSFIESGFLEGISPTSAAGQLISTRGGLPVGNTLGLRSDEDQAGIALDNFRRLLESAVNNRGERLFDDERIEALSRDPTALLEAVENAQRRFNSEADGIQAIFDANGPAETAFAKAIDRGTLASGNNEFDALQALLRASGLFEEINATRLAEERRIETERERLLAEQENTKATEENNRILSANSIATGAFGSSSQFQLAQSLRRSADSEYARETRDFLGQLVRLIPMGNDAVFNALNKSTVIARRRAT